MEEVKRSEIQRADAELEVTRLRAELDRQLTEHRVMQVLSHTLKIKDPDIIRKPEQQQFTLQWRTE